MYKAIYNFFFSTPKPEPIPEKVTYDMAIESGKQLSKAAKELSKAAKELTDKL